MERHRMRYRIRVSPGEAWLFGWFYPVPPYDALCVSGVNLRSRRYITGLYDQLTPVSRYDGHRRLVRLLRDELTYRGVFDED